MRFAFMLMVAFASLPFCTVWADEAEIELKDVPKPVMEAVKKRFPQGELTEASKEEADGKTTYEVSVKQAGKNIDVTLTPDGKITMIEKEIASKDLPKAVTETIEKKYPKATYKLAEEVTVVEDGKEKLGYYEALIATADGKQIELEVTSDGTIKHEENKSGKDGEEKKEEKKEDKKK